MASSGFPLGSEWLSGGKRLADADRLRVFLNEVDVLLAQVGGLTGYIVLQSEADFPTRGERGRATLSVEKAGSRGTDRFSDRANLL